MRPPLKRSSPAQSPPLTAPLRTQSAGTGPAPRRWACTVAAQPKSWRGTTAVASPAQKTKLSVSGNSLRYQTFKRGTQPELDPGVDTATLGGPPSFGRRAPPPRRVPARPVVTGERLGAGHGRPFLAECRPVGGEAGGDGGKMGSPDSPRRATPPNCTKLGRRVRRGCTYPGRRRAGAAIGSPAQAAQTLRQKCCFCDRHQTFKRGTQPGLGWRGHTVTLGGPPKFGRRAPPPRRVPARPVVTGERLGAGHGRPFLAECRPVGGEAGGDGGKMGSPDSPRRATPPNCTKLGRRVRRGCTYPGRRRAGAAIGSPAQAAQTLRQKCCFCDRHQTFKRGTQPGLGWRGHTVTLGGPPSFGRRAPPPRRVRGRPLTAGIDRADGTASRHETGLAPNRREVFLHLVVVVCNDQDCESTRGWVGGEYKLRVYVVYGR